MTRTATSAARALSCSAAKRTSSSGRRRRSRACRSRCKWRPSTTCETSSCAGASGDIEEEACRVPLTSCVGSSFSLALSTRPRSSRLSLLLHFVARRLPCSTRSSIKTASASPRRPQSRCVSIRRLVLLDRPISPSHTDTHSCPARSSPARRRCSMVRQPRRRLHRHCHRRRRARARSGAVVAVPRRHELEPVLP